MDYLERKRMSSTEDFVRERIKDLYGSIPKFAREIEIPEQSIYTVLRKGFGGSSINVVIPICKALHLDPMALRDGRIRGVDPEFMDMQVVSVVSAGIPIDELAVEGITHPVPIAMGKAYPNAKLVKVNGTSMDRVLPDGSMALVDFGAEVKTGDIALVCADGADGVIKRVRLLTHGIELIPDSTDPTHETELIRCSDEGCTNIEVRGKVIWCTLPFDFIVPWKHD